MNSTNFIQLLIVQFLPRNISHVQIFGKTVFQSALSICVLPLWPETQFHTHT